MPEQTTGKDQFKCTECGKTLHSQSELQDHQKTHQAQKQQGGATHQAGGGGHSHS
jgi:C2H2 type zinc finger protein